uniref:Uncharacterized protein n=1 Tax=Paulinella longichromatophora TaxID=1708747 RepID=A0A2H4ZQA7_9EUKA|nr:hypothetical protein PLO_752 [Paulinella longichromatophora]
MNLSSDLVLKSIPAIAAIGNQLCDDFSCDESFLAFASFNQPPYFLAILGLVISIICGVTFTKQIEHRLDEWKKSQFSLLPLRTVQLNLSYSGILLGIILFISGSLQVFGLANDKAFCFALLLSLMTGGTLWVQIERLMKQVENGEFKVVDFDNFDQFF